MTSLSCIEHDGGLRRLVVLRTQALETTDYKLEEESEKIPLFHVDFAAVTEAQRETHSKQLIYLKGCGSPLKLKSIMIEYQCGHYRKLLHTTEPENIKTYVTLKAQSRFYCRLLIVTILQYNSIDYQFLQ